MDGEKPKRFSPSIYFKTSFKKVYNETSALTWKNYLIFSRNKYLTLMLIICPFFICLYLFRVQITIEGYTKGLSNPNPREYSISKIPKCIGEDCITLGFGLTGGNTDFSDYIIDHISHSSSLKKGKDIKVLSTHNPASFLDYIRNNHNKTSIGIILCTNYISLPENNYLDKIRCDDTIGHAYLILYNFTVVSKNLFDTNLPDPIESKVLAAKLAMDNAIFSFECKKRGLRDVVVEAIIQSFPLPESRFLKGYDSPSMTGPFYFFIPPMFVFGLLISEIVKEKELKLRNGLNVIGVSAASFWLSWFLVALFFSFMTTNSLIFSAYFFKFELFLKTPYPLLFLLFMTYSLSMLTLGFFLSTLIDSVKLAYTVSYSFLLGGLVLQNFFMSQTLIKLFHLEDLPDWVSWVKVGFSFYPPYSFARIFCHIAYKSGRVPNYVTRMWESGPGYTYNDFITEREGEFDNMHYIVPSDLSGILDICRNFFILIVLTWFFDHVVPGNRGRPSPVWFLFTRDYWKCKRKLEKNSSEVELTMIGKNPMKGCIMGNDDEFTEGIKLDGIWKIYNGAEEPAVKPLNFIIEKEECLAIIGHNGAGKTTLLSMLTGLLKPSGGTAYISSFDIEHELDKIQLLIGYCPQFNILWDELTASEHLYLFAKLRNTPIHIRDDLVQEKLHKVNLIESADRPVGTFSGGMKRRLSVIISSIGNPSVIFMDEPTTGMDPITRREVWKLIQDLKKDRVIILTTHSMEEAEMLSDRVAVMVDGNIKCSGTCLFLKNTYGQGFKVELINENPQDLWKALEKNIKSVKLENISGNSLNVSIPRTESEDAKKFFEFVEKIQVQEWGLSNSSLEEVFMRVTGKLDGFQ